MLVRSTSSTSSKNGHDAGHSGEVGRLRLPRGTVELIQRLVDHGPDNLLHLALAFRANPGLDLTTQVFDGSGLVVDVVLTGHANYKYGP